MIITEKSTEKITVLTRRQREQLITFILVIVDIVCIGCAFLLAYLVRFIVLPYASTFDFYSYSMVMLAMIPVWLAIFAIYQLYNHHVLFGGMGEYARAFNAVSTCVITLVIITFLRRDDFLVSRGWLIIGWMLAVFLVILFRFSFRRVIYALRRRGMWLAPAVIVGVDQEAHALAEQLQHWQASGLHLVGFVDASAPLGASIYNGLRVIGNLNSLESLVSKGGVQEIIISPTALNREELLNIFQVFGSNPDINLRFSSGLFELLNTGLRVKELAYVPLIEINKNRISGVDAFLKTLMDYSTTIVGLVIISPLLLVLALLVRRDSPGPIIFKRRVMGVNGTQFDAYKFRTMVANGDEILDSEPELKERLLKEHKLKDDPRVTRIGYFLRKYSLDELPQLFNVLKGQMSLVGPRMISPPEMAKYDRWGMNLLTVRPGITGLWQVSGRSDVSYEERVRMDMYYIRNWTIWLDVYLLLATLPAVLRKRGAY